MRQLIGLRYKMPLQGFVSDQRGTMLPIFAMMLTVATAGGALAVDMARAYAFRDQLQLTAEAAALAAAVSLPDVDAARKAAYHYASKNMAGFGDIIGADDIEFGHWDPKSRALKSDKEAPSALRVTARLAEKNGNAINTIFAGVFGEERLDVAASAVAGKRSAMCILALEQLDADGLGMDVSANIEALNCTVQVNSRHEYAFRIWLGSKFLASGLCVVGGAYVSGWVSISPEPTLGCPPQPDPLAALAAPAVGACDHHDSVFDTHNGTLQPGVYCGGLTVKGASDLTLAAGTYVIKDGPLAVFDTSMISDDGVTFFLTGDDGLVRFDDQSSLTLAYLAKREDHHGTMRLTRA